MLPLRYNRGQPPNRYSQDQESIKAKYSIAHYTSTQRLSEPLKAFAHKLSTEYTPSIIEKAFKDPQWTKAIVEKMTALQKNRTWMLVPLPEGKRKVGCKWVFSIKHKADGSVERYKARLVAKDTLRHMESITKKLFPLLQN